MDLASIPAGVRHQFRLRDLAVVVVGASVVVDAARRSREAWGGNRPDLAHGLGLALLALGLVVGAVVVGRVPAREVREWGLAWRAAAVAWLAGALAGLVVALQEVAQPGPPPFGGGTALGLRVALLMTALGLVGLVLAATPGRARRRPVGRRGRWGSWPSILLAAAVGVVLLALGHALIPYLVLIAIEAVHNALSRAPLVPRPALADRVAMAGVEALPGLVGCLVTAAWVDDDLRRAARDPGGVDAGPPRPWPMILMRGAGVALAGLGGAWTLFAATPRLSPPLAEGLGVVLTPGLVATVVAGFAMFAAGLAARGAAGRPATGPDATAAGPVPGLRWPRRIAAIGVGLICLEITAAAAQLVAHDLTERWYIPVSLYGWGQLIGSVIRPFRPAAGIPGWEMLFSHPDTCLVAAAAIWLAARLAGRLWAGQPGSPAPLDALAADRRAAGRFGAWWVALTVAIVASLPGLAAVAVALFQRVLAWTGR